VLWTAIGCGQQYVALTWEQYHVMDLKSSAGKGGSDRVVDLYADCLTPRNIW